MINDIFERCVHNGFVNRTDSAAASGQTGQARFVSELTQFIIEMFECNLWLSQYEEWTRSDLSPPDNSVRDRDGMRKNLIQKIDSLLGMENAYQSAGHLVDQMTFNYVKIKSLIDSWDVSAKDTGQLNDLLSTYFASKIRAHGLFVGQDFQGNSTPGISLAHGSPLDSNRLDAADRPYGFQNVPETSGFWDV